MKEIKPLTPEEISHKLLEKQIKPSVQRVIVYGYLWKNRTHPTVDEIYRDLVSLYPSLSRTTIYNTLKIFVANKLIIPILIEENEMRFDVDCSSHAHFKCVQCQHVCDMAIEPPPALVEYQIDEAHLYYKGLCPCCQQT